MTEDILYIHDCLDEIAATGKTTIGEEGFSSLHAAYEALKASEWIDTKELTPEQLPENKGKKMIACLVATAPPKSQPGRKPHVTVAQRQLVEGFRSPPRWEWSRCLDVIKWRPVPEVD